jgi:hypothetical protein
VPLSYDPQHAVPWVPKAGTYAFRVTRCEAASFKTGASGIRLTLMVEAGGRSPLGVATTIVFGERSTWKMLELCRCVGVRFDPPCEASDLEGQTGRAEFEADERSGRIGLRVLRYLPRGG